MGTPHAGSSVTTLKRVEILKAIAKASFKQAPEKLLRALEANSDELCELSDAFERTTIFTERKVEMSTYYELMTTKLVGAEVRDEWHALSIIYRDICVFSLSALQFFLLTFHFLTLTLLQGRPPGDGKSALRQRAFGGDIGGS